MSYTNLITYDRLTAADSAKITESVTADEAKAVIEGVSSLTRSRLSRVLIVEAVTQRFGPRDWMRDETQADAFRAWGDEQPLVEVAPDADQPDDALSTASIRDEQTLSAGRNEAGALKYFAGWRRPDQVLSAPDPEETVLPTGADESLDGLTTLPPALPSVFQQVAVDVTLHVIKRRDQNLGQRSTRTVGGQESVVEGADPSFLSREIGRLSEYDRSQIPR